MGKLVLILYFADADFMGGLRHMGGWGWVGRNDTLFCSIGGPLQNPIKIGRMGLLILMEFSHHLVGIFFLPFFYFIPYDIQKLDEFRLIHVRYELAHWEVMLSEHDFFLIRKIRTRGII